jgi:hypothetical protein
VTRTRPYEYYDTTISICTQCHQRVQAKVVFQDGSVFMHKHCAAHGTQRVLLADDVAYYRAARERFLKPSEMPLRFSTPTRWGCPYDCGLCPDHEQHSCLSIVEITDGCNLRCPVCYAESGPDRMRHRPLSQVIAMLDAVVRSEGEPDVVQISGGEPTLHPELFAILDAARERPFRHLMLNTNGVRLAKDPELARRLSRYGPGFELYLQFDSFSERALRTLRGEDLRDVRERALGRCEEAKLPVTLVVTVARGVNDHELGAIVDHALRFECVRGVTFQPIQAAGRVEGYDAASHRLTLTEVRRKLLEQSSLFGAEDILPVPCHPDAIAMAYALRAKGAAVPLSRHVPLDVLLTGARNTISYEREPALRDAVFALFSTGSNGEPNARRLSDLLCCLPRVEAPEQLRYEHVFRVIIMEFADAHAFDLRSVKKSCVHIVHPDGRLIPFDTYNLFYRDDRERALLTLRQKASL